MKIAKQPACLHQLDLTKLDARTLGLKLRQLLLQKGNFQSLQLIMVAELKRSEQTAWDHEGADRHPATHS